MRIALCNEVLAGMPLERQCEYAARLGYDGLEIAPFTLSDSPEKISTTEAARIRAVVEASGLVVTGLHWLLVKPDGLSLTDPDPTMRARTIEVMVRLTALCAELGGAVLVHGSPKQRAIAPGDSHATALSRLRDGLVQVAATAANAGVIYCIEPLSPRETALVNTIAEAAELVRSIDHPHLRTMIDCSAAGFTETEPVASLIDRWLPTGLIAHLQVNDPNRRGPGQGEMKFAAVLAALKRHDYTGTIAVEPFDYSPDGVAAAAFSVGYLRGLREALDFGVDRAAC
jgi:D-psicose/D-tagatose/L-ribulose 3-epimerase